MSKAVTTQADAAPSPEIVGVLDFWQPGDSNVLLHEDALAQVNAALNAISTCANLLNSREVDRGDRELCSVVTHGLVAAIQTATELVRIVTTDGRPQGVLKLRGAHAKAASNAAWREWNAARAEEGNQA